VRISGIVGLSFAFFVGSAGAVTAPGVPAAAAADGCVFSPTARVAGVPSLGAVDIHDEEKGFLIRGGQADPNLGFGAAVVLSDFDADGCMDLLVGAPGEAAVVLLRGSNAEPRPQQIALPHSGRQSDRFGTALAVEKVVGPDGLPTGLQRIWVGAPEVDVAGHRDAGAVMYYTITSDLTISGPVILTQNSPGVPGAAEVGDRMGEVLAPVGAVHEPSTASVPRDAAPLGSGVVIGMPKEDVGSAVDAGAVLVLPAPGSTPPGPGPYAVTQNSPGVPATAEAGDRFGAAVDNDHGLWVGVPGEDLKSERDAGMVHEFAIGRGSMTSVAAISQASPGLPGTPEGGDEFGTSVQGLAHSCGDFAPDPRSAALIGVPGEDVGKVKDAGSVLVYRRDADPRCATTSVTQRLGTAAQNRFGQAVARPLRESFDFGGDLDVSVAAPGADIGSAADAGVVEQLFTLGPSLLHSPLSLSSGAESHQRYGSVLAKAALNQFQD
jgi:hypothetical protein